MPNKLTGDIRSMIKSALDGAGGVNYLQRQAVKNPSAFMSLVGRTVPAEVHGAGADGEHKVTVTLKW